MREKRESEKGTEDVNKECGCGSAVSYETRLSLCALQSSVSSQRVARIKEEAPNNNVMIRSEVDSTGAAGHATSELRPRE